MVTIYEEDVMETVYVPKLERLFLLDKNNVWWRIAIDDYDEIMDPVIEGEATPEDILLLAEVKKAMAELGKLKSWNPKDPNTRKWLLVVFPSIPKIEHELRNRRL